jgi:hypothetical protein
MTAWEAGGETVVAGRWIVENCGFGNAFGHNLLFPDNCRAHVHCHLRSDRAIPRERLRFKSGALLHAGILVVVGRNVRLVVG